MNQKQIILAVCGFSIAVMVFITFSLKGKNDELSKINLDQHSRLESAEATLAAVNAKFEEVVSNFNAIKSSMNQTPTNQNTVSYEELTNGLAATPKLESHKIETRTNNPPVMVTFTSPSTYESGMRMHISNNSQDDIKFTITINRSNIYTPIIKGGGWMKGGAWTILGITRHTEIEISAEGYTPLNFHCPEQWLQGGKPLFFIEPPQ